MYVQHALKRSGAILVTSPFGPIPITAPVRNARPIRARLTQSDSECGVTAIFTTSAPAAAMPAAMVSRSAGIPL